MAKGQTQTQQQTQVQLQFLDNGIHRLFIALERLEAFLAEEMQAPKPDKQVAIKTGRDLHDDEANPPTKQGYYSELHLQILNVSKQGRFSDGSEMIDSSASYFLNDLLEWYSLRQDVEPNDVERFAVPIIAALADKRLNAEDITKLIYKYVGDLDNDLSKKSEEEKERAIISGFTAWIKAQQKVSEEMQRFEKDDIKVQLTSHTRGSATAGYEHLKAAFTALYPADTTPVLLLERETNRLCPALIEQTVSNENPNNPTS